VAIEPSRQFKESKNPKLDQQLEIAKIRNLETDSAKNRQIVMESIQNMYGSNKPFKGA
jgi:hypothetical protein